MAYDVVPADPAAVLESLGPLGSTLESAIADLVGNSIDTGAGTVGINFHWNGPDSHDYGTWVSDRHKAGLRLNPAHFLLCTENVAAPWSRVKTGWVFPLALPGTRN